MRSKGDPVDVTPGWRSAAVIEETFGLFPMELHQEDEAKLILMARAARVYTHRSIWDELLEALHEHGIVTLQTEY